MEPVMTITCGMGACMYLHACGRVGRLMEPVMTITCGMDIRACDAYDACNGRVRGVQCSAVRASEACMHATRAMRACDACNACDAVHVGGR